MVCPKATTRWTSSTPTGLTWFWLLLCVMGLWLMQRFVLLRALDFFSTCGALGGSEAIRLEALWLFLGALRL